MNWFVNTLGSSIGKKLLMALTGLSFVGFLVVHLVGNLTLYGGPGVFNSYVGHLLSLGPVITVAEIGLCALGLVHVCTGLLLFYGNLQARPVRYQVNKNAGGRTLGSATMPYTGLIMLAFLVMHLFTLRFADKAGTTLYDIVATIFSHPFYVIIYLFVMAVVAVHISHGFWSLFQTLGANHPKYMPLIQALGIVASVAFGVGFGFIPLFICFSA